MVERVAGSEEVDWESPAGRTDQHARAGHDAPDYLFAGPGDAHWIGQLCAVVGALPGNPDGQLVRLACGCRAQVPRASLQLR